MVSACRAAAFFIASAIFMAGLAMPTSSTGAVAGTIHVPSDQPTIQDAIDAAMDGDTVLVAPGTYFENIDFLGKAIVVTSEAGRYAPRPGSPPRRG